MNPPLNIETLRAHWANDWLEPLGAQIFRMQHDKELRDEFLEMIQAAPDTGGGIFAGHYNDLYVASQVMAVRRLDDDDGRTLSLRRLIGQVFQHRNLFTRDWYAARWAKEDDDELMADWRRRAAEDVFDRFVDEPGAARIGGRRLQEDQKELRRLTSAITEFATTWVAHHQAARDGVIPTYDQFEVAVAHVAEVFDRYYLLITFASLLSTKPAIQPDWKAPFRQPLAEAHSEGPDPDRQSEPPASV